MNLIKTLILLLLVYEVVSAHKKKKPHKKCHKKHKCCKHHKEVPHAEEVHNFPEKDDEESPCPWHHENLSAIFERDFEALHVFFNPEQSEHHNLEDDLTPLKFNEHIGLDEDPPSEDILKMLLNKFLKKLFEKHLNHDCNEELMKKPLIDHLDDDCKKSLKLLLSKCLETVESKDCFKKLLELPLKDVFDEENMNHLHNIFGHLENKDHILGYLLELPLNALLNPKIIDIPHMDNHEDIFEHLLHLPLTDIFEVKEPLILKKLVAPGKLDHFQEDIHSDLGHTHEDTDSLFKSSVEKHIADEEIKEDISKHLAKSLIIKLIIAKKVLIEHEKTKILKELLEHSVKEHVNNVEHFATKALLTKLGEDIVIKSILKESIDRSVKDHINHNELALKALLNKGGKDILIKSILKAKAEHSLLDEKVLLPKHVEENDKEHEVKEKLLTLMILKHVLNHQNKLEEVPVQKEDANLPDLFKGNEDRGIDFEKLMEELQKSTISQATPSESFFNTPLESSIIIDIPANPEESYIIEKPANPVESFIIDSQSENSKGFDEYSDIGLWDYYNQFAHLIDREPDEEICIGCYDDDDNDDDDDDVVENIYLNYEH